jgi:hypothetical protein
MSSAAAKSRSLKSPSSLVADIMMKQLGGARFTWGSGGGDLQAAGKDRAAYFSALREADARDFGPLLTCA